MTELFAIIASHIFMLYIIMRAARLAREEDNPVNRFESADPPPIRPDL
jgi:hypothetical protein